MRSRGSKISGADSLGVSDSTVLTVVNSRQRFMCRGHKCDGTGRAAESQRTRLGATLLRGFRVGRLSRNALDTRESLADPRGQGRGYPGSRGQLSAGRLLPEPQGATSTCRRFTGNLIACAVPTSHPAYAGYDAFVIGDKVRFVILRGNGRSISTAEFPIDEHRRR